MALSIRLIVFLLIATTCLTWAQESTRLPETTTHINPHLPVTIPIRDGPEELTTHNSYLYRGRPISTINFGGPARRRVFPVNRFNITDHNTRHRSASISSSSYTIEHPQHDPTLLTTEPTTGWRWVHSGGRWHRIHGGTDNTIHTDTSRGTSQEHVSGSGHRDHLGHHVVHVDSSETNNWNHAIHHELNSGQTQKHYSKTSDSLGRSSPDDSSSSSDDHSGSGGSHASSGSGESVSSGSGEHSASGSGSE